MVWEREGIPGFPGGYFLNWWPGFLGAMGFVVKGGVYLEVGLLIGGPNVCPACPLSLPYEGPL